MHIVCACICVCVCTFLLLGVHAFVCTHVCACVYCPCVCMCVCIVRVCVNRVCMCVAWVCMLCAWMHLCAHTCVCAHACRCVGVCVIAQMLIHRQGSGFARRGGGRPPRRGIQADLLPVTAPAQNKRFQNDPHLLPAPLLFPAPPWAPSQAYPSILPGRASGPEAEQHTVHGRVREPRVHPHL